MSYTKRDWDTTGSQVTKEDFKRIENGIESNDKQINDCYKTVVQLEKCYVSLASLGLTDVEFSGLTITQAFDLFLSKFTINSGLYCRIKLRLDSSTINLKSALGSKFSNGIVLIEVGSHGRYTATWTNSDSTVGAFSQFTCSGYKGINSGWQQIATTTKTSFLCVANTGFTIVGQQNYTMNGEYFITLTLKRTDSSIFKGKETYSVAVSPKAPKSTHIGCFMGRNTNVSTKWNIVGNVFYQGGNNIIYVLPAEDCNEAYITLKGGLA